MSGNALGEGGSAGTISQLNELCQRQGVVPDYFYSRDGPDHRPTFVCTVEVGLDRQATGTGASKQAARQEYATFLPRTPLTPFVR